MTPPAPLSRPTVTCGLSLVHALMLGSAALILPWRMDLILHGAVGLLVLSYLTVAVASVLRSAWLPRAARFCAALNLSAFLGLVIQVGLWCVYLHGLYTEVGWTLVGGLLVFFCALALFLVPFPVFLWLAFPREKSARTAAAVPAAEQVGAAVVFLLVAGPFNEAWAAGPGQPISPPSAIHSADLRAIQTAWAAIPVVRHKKTPPLGHVAPVQCDARLSLSNAWIVTSTRQGSPVSHCLQGTSEEKARQLKSVLNGQAGPRLKLDILHTRGERRSESNLLSALSLRPGQDSLCVRGRCLLPWQLIMANQYVSYSPFAQIPESRFGVDVEALVLQLGGSASSLATQITTDSYLLAKDAAGRVSTTQLLRMSAGPIEVTGPRLHAAQTAAIDYILGAQNDDGSFRYTLDPYSGTQDNANIVLPRHGGTTLALCELGPSDARVRRAAQRATQLIESFYHKVGKYGYFSRTNPSSVIYRDTTLPTVALFECARAGHIKLPESWPSLAEFLLRQQRRDGSFAVHFDRKKRKPSGDGEIFFAAGQALYALVLMEEHLINTAPSKKHERLQTRIHDSVQRAMSYYSGEYWQRAPHSFFFLEENWHCLAARAALRVHRHDAYERFCLDYATFKARFIQTSTAQAFQGGLTLSPMFPPHSTATSGFAEATAAALAVSYARKEAHPQLEHRLRLALGYLLQIQINASTCFACKGRAAWGGFTESPVSGPVRIDFVQHALSALGHGQRVLAL
jgi:hypothetical protein